MRLYQLLILSSLLLMGLLPVGLFAAAEVAVIREVKGKVEYQLQGKSWVAAKVGVALPKGSMISTGFKSSASLEVMGSVIFIKPLTRMVLEDLVKTSSETKTGLKLLSGKVKTEVKPSSEASETVFEVKSPTATASVRGTGFEFDGENILVNHGKVEFANRYGQARQVQGGEFSSAGKRGAVSPPIAVKPAEKPVITATGGAEEVNSLVGEEPPAPLPAEEGTEDAPAEATEEEETSEESPEEAAPEASPEASAADPAAEPDAAPVEEPPAAEAELPTPELDLGNVIDTYGDDLFVDTGTVSAAEEIKKIQEETLAEAVVIRYQLNLELK